MVALACSSNTELHLILSKIAHVQTCQNKQGKYNLANHHNQSTLKQSDRCSQLIHQCHFVLSRTVKLQSSPQY